MHLFSASGLTVLAGLGVVAGLALLARGLAGYRSVLRVGDVSTSVLLAPTFLSTFYPHAHDYPQAHPGKAARD